MSKLIRLALVLALSAVPACATWSRAQGAKGGSATDGTSVGTVATAAMTSALTNPSIIVVYTGYGTTPNVGNVSSVTDTAGNSYSFVTDVEDTINFQAVEMWWAINTHTTASNVVTVHFTLNASFAFVMADEYTGGGPHPVIDTAAVSTTVTPSTTAPGPYLGTAVTPTTNGDLIVGTFVQDTHTTNTNTVTANGSFTIGSVNQDSNGEWATEWFSQAAKASAQTSFSWQTTPANDAVGTVIMTASFKTSINLVQSTSGVSGAVASFAQTFASNVANGDLVIACTTFGNNLGGTTYAATDNKSGGSNTYTAFVTVELAVSTNSDLWCGWAIHSGSAAALQVTITVTGGGSHTMRMAIFDYNSTMGWPASPVDRNSGNFGAGSVTTGTSGNISPSVSGTLVFSALQLNASGVSAITLSGCCVEQTAGGTSGNGWASSDRADSSDNQNGTTTANQNATYSWTGAAPFSAIIQNFKPSTGGAPAPTTFPQVVKEMKHETPGSVVRTALGNSGAGANLEHREFPGSRYAPGSGDHSASRADQWLCRRSGDYHDQRLQLCFELYRKFERDNVSDDVREYYLAHDGRAFGEGGGWQ